MAFYDVCWYWKGNRWHAADAGTRSDLERMGYVARDGRRSIGPPDGAPSRQALADALSANLPEAVKHGNLYRSALALARGGKIGGAA